MARTRDRASRGVARAQGASILDPRGMAPRAQRRGELSDRTCSVVRSTGPPRKARVLLALRQLDCMFTANMHVARDLDDWADGRTASGTSRPRPQPPNGPRTVVPPGRAIILTATAGVDLECDHATTSTAVDRAALSERVAPVPGLLWVGNHAAPAVGRMPVAAGRACFPRQR